SLKQYTSFDGTRTTVFEKVYDFVIVTEIKPDDNKWEVEKAVTIPKVFFTFVLPDPEDVKGIEKDNLSAIGHRPPSARGSCCARGIR
ncbi:MAG: hypothetical protein AAF970_18055, partial [Bacteroidota bacterium]